LSASEGTIVDEGV